MKKVFFDCEFTGLHQNTTLISMGLVSDCGQEAYCDFYDYDITQVDGWLEENVLRHTGIEAWKKLKSRGTYLNADSKIIAEHLTAWFKSFNEPIKIISDCLAYDWVLLCQLLGDKKGAMGMPDCINYIPFDICTAFEMTGIDPDVNREKYAGITSGVKHNALHDARVIKACYERMMQQ